MIEVPLAVGEKIKTTIFLSAVGGVSFMTEYNLAFKRENLLGYNVYLYLQKYFVVVNSNLNVKYKNKMQK